MLRWLIALDLIEFAGEPGGIALPKSEYYAESFSRSTKTGMICGKLTEIGLIGMDR